MRNEVPTENTVKTKWNRCKEIKSEADLSMKNFKCIKYELTLLSKD